MMASQVTGKEKHRVIEPPKDIHWLSDSDYKKAIGQLRLQFNGVFSPFRAYGQDVFIPGAIGECVKLAEDFGLRVRGIDKVIALDIIRRKSGRFVD